MVRVGEDDLPPSSSSASCVSALNCAERAHGHERRRVDHAVRSFQAAEARAGRIGGQNFKTKRHSPSVSGEHRGDAHLDENEDDPNPDDPCERGAEFDFFGAHG